MDNDSNQFVIIRDSIAQITYSLLFDYIVKKINQAFECDYDIFIGILVIFGEISK